MAKRAAKKPISEQGRSIYSFAINHISEIVTVVTKPNGNRVAFKSNEDHCEEAVSVIDMIQIIKAHQAIIDQVQQAVDLLLSNEYEGESEYSIGVVKRPTDRIEMDELKDRLERAIDQVNDEVRSLSRNLDNNVESIKYDLSEIRSDVNALQD